MPLELAYADFSRLTSGSTHRKDVYRMCAGVPHALFLWYVLLSDDKSSFSHERPPSLSSNFWIIKGSGLFSQLEQRPRKDRVPWASFLMSSFFPEQSQGETLGAKFTRVNTRRTKIFFTTKCTPGECLMQFLHVSSVTSQSVLIAHSPLEAMGSSGGLWAPPLQELSRQPLPYLLPSCRRSCGGWQMMLFFTLEHLNKNRKTKLIFQISLWK